MQNNRGIDSCKILFEIDSLYYDSRLNNKVYEIYSDGTILKEYENKPFTYSTDCVDTHYGIIKLFGRRYLYVLANSKMLGSRYFEAIQKDTLKSLYGFINSQGIIQISFENFCKGKLTDVDIKTDFDLYDEQFYKFCYDRKKQLVYPKFHSKRPNLGLEYVKRSTATPSNPYVKYYSKYAELTTRSKIFKNRYFPHFHNENLRRCEVTIRNHDHKAYIERKLFKLPSTLIEWCSLTQQEYKQIIVHCVEQHEMHFKIPIDPKKYERNVNGLTSRDYFFLKIYEEFKKLDYSDEQILNLYTKRSNKPDNTHYQEKARLNKLIRKIREVSINNKKPELPF